MSKRNNPLKKHSSQLRVLSKTSNDESDVAIQQMIANQGTEQDWRNGITVPRPRIWEERPELIGKVVIPHSCIAEEYREHPDYKRDCICRLIGKPVKIIGLHTDSMFDSGVYRIRESRKPIREREFSDETRGKEWDDVNGYILENAGGKFLTAGFVWMPAKKPLDGYLHNSQVVRDLLTAEFPNGRPTKAYPASSKLDGGQKRITGDAVAFDQLTL